MEEKLGCKILCSKSGIEVNVPRGRSILKALLDAGVEVDFDCFSGECGTCVLKIRHGQVIHRDVYLTDAERSEGLFCPCVATTGAECLVLDI